MSQAKYLSMILNRKFWCKLSNILFDKCPNLKFQIDFVGMEVD